MIITSTSKRWPGCVTFRDYLTYPAFIEARDHFALAVAFKETKPKPAEWERSVLPGIFVCVQEWHLENMPEPLTPDSFPATPRKEVSVLVSMLLSAATAIINGESESPPA